MTYTTIDSQSVGNPVLKDWGNQIRTNQEDHETRINAIEGGNASKIIVFNRMIEFDVNRVGDVRWSFLSTTEFQKRFGTDWVKIDGSSISGTDLEGLYGSTLPDGRNRFSRITDESTRTIGTLETNQNKAHTHDVTVTGNETSTPTVGQVDFYGGGDADSDTFTSTSNGGTEARPDSIVLNAFTRKNDWETDIALIHRTPFAFTITDAIVTTLTAGSAGDLEVDVKKGSSLGSLSTIFSTKPKVNYATGNNASSSNAVISSNSVAANDWIKVDITSVQTAQNRFHLWLIGEIS